MTNCHSCGDVYKHSDARQRAKCEAWYDEVLAGGTPLGLAPRRRRSGVTFLTQMHCVFILTCGMAINDKNVSEWAKWVAFAIATASTYAIIHEVER